MKDFFSKYKFYILAPVVMFIIFTVILIVLSHGPQKGAFVYQIR